MSTLKKRLLNLAIIILIAGIAGLFPPVFTQAATATIIIDGNTDDWVGIDPLSTDPDEDDFIDDNGFLVNDNLDLKALYVTHDADNLYIRVDVYGNIDRTNPNKYFVYFDTDQNGKTGLTFDWWTTGADYQIYMDESKIGLQIFMGTNQADDTWGWGGVIDAVESIEYAYNGGTIEYAVPRGDIGETNAKEATIVLARTWPGDDAIPYYDAIPLVYTYYALDPVIDNFEYPTDEELRAVYTVEACPGGALELFSKPTIVKQGGYSAKLTYTLNGLWCMVTMNRDIPDPEDWSKYKNITLWVKGYSGSVDNFLFYIIESDGDEWFYQSTKVLVNDAWTKVVIPLSALEDNQFDGGKGDGIKTLTGVVGYKIGIHDVTDDGVSPTNQSIYIDNIIGDDGTLSPPHSIPDVDNYVVYYGQCSDKMKELSKFDMVVVQPGNCTAAEIAQLQAGGTKVLVYVSLGEDAYRPLQPGDGSGPICNGVLQYNGYASYYLDGLGGVCDGIPDQNGIWGGYYINAGNAEWQDYIINTVIRDIIDKSADGLFLDTIGIVSVMYIDEDGNGHWPYEWISPGMISMIAAIREAYPDHYLMANRGFHIFEDIEEYINALMFESFTSTYDFETKEYKIIEPDIFLVNRINTFRGYPDYTTINVFSLDYCAIDDFICQKRAYKIGRSFGFIPSVSNIALDKIYPVPIVGIGLIRQRTSGGQGLYIYSPPDIVGGNIGDPIASALVIGNVNNDYRVILTVADDFDSDGVDEIGMIRRKRNGKQGLYIYNVPIKAGEYIDKSVVSDRLIGNVNNNTDVILATAGNFPAIFDIHDIAYEIGLIRQKKTSGVQGLFVYNPPKGVRQDIGDPIASDPRIGNANKNTNVILATAGNFDTSCDYKIGQILLCPDEITLIRENNKGRQGLFIYNPPDRVGGDIGKPIGCDKNIGKNVKLMIAGDFDSDGVDEIGMIREKSSGVQGLFIYNTPTEICGDIGNPIASDPRIGRADLNNRIVLATGIDVWLDLTTETLNIGQ